MAINAEHCVKHNFIPSQPHPTKFRFHINWYPKVTINILLLEIELCLHFSINFYFLWFDSSEKSFHMENNSILKYFSYENKIYMKDLYGWLNIWLYERTNQYCHLQQWITLINKTKWCYCILVNELTSIHCVLMQNNITSLIIAYYSVNFTEPAWEFLQ